MQIPASDFRPDCLHRRVRNCRTEVDEVLPLAILRSPRPESVAEKIELLVRVRPSPILILAIDNLRLLRMKFQPTVLQASGYGHPNVSVECAGLFRLYPHLLKGSNAKAWSGCLQHIPFRKGVSHDGADDAPSAAHDRRYA